MKLRLSNLPGADADQLSRADARGAEACTMSVDHVLWLTTREHAALLAHAICGDLLSHPDHAPDWFAPSNLSRSDRLLLVGYEGVAATLRLCAVLPDVVSTEWVTQLREQVSPQGAEMKWAHFVGQLGRFERAAEASSHWADTVFIHQGRRWQARRRRHPSAVIDRLLMRDRAETQDLLRALFDAPREEVGEDPSPAQRANVGDNLTE